MRAIKSSVIAFICVALSAVASAQAGAPLDLADATPRWIEVRFEVSPANEPGRLDHAWSGPRRAFLEPISDAGNLRIRVPADEVEAHLRTTGTDAIAGSFSDFVWEIDPVSGHVVRANLVGSVRETVVLGWIRTSAEVDIEVHMDTFTHSGFRTGGIFGQQTHRHCTGSDRASDCTWVAPARFDPDRGYVNAVGSVIANTAVARLRAFSPLGEALFSESAGKTTEEEVSDTTRSDVTCSERSPGPCGPDHGGES